MPSMAGIWTGLTKIMERKSTTGPHYPPRSVRHIFCSIIPISSPLEIRFEERVQRNVCLLLRNFPPCQCEHRSHCLRAFCGLRVLCHLFTHRHFFWSRTHCLSIGISTVQDFQGLREETRQARHHQDQIHISEFLHL